MVGARIFLQVDTIVQDRPQDSVGQPIVIFLKVILRQIDDGIGYVIALDDAWLRRLRFVDLAAPAEPHAGAISQRRFHRDHESSRHLLVSWLGYGDSVRNDDEARAHASSQLDDGRFAALVISATAVSTRGAC